MPVNQINKENDEFELKETCINNSDIKKSWTANLVYTFMGILFGIVFVKAEIVSWFRIQEMFRFESFHMYGVIGTALFIRSAYFGTLSAQRRRCRCLDRDGTGFW